MFCQMNYWHMKLQKLLQKLKENPGLNRVIICFLYVLLLAFLC